jgi:hypothetical protein
VEVARSLILPEFMAPSATMLATLSLFWESIEVPVFHGTPDPPEEEQELISTLIDEGIVRLHHLSGVRGLDDALLAEAKDVARAWSRTPPGTTAETIDLPVAEELIVARARRAAAVTQRRAERGIELAAELWAAPVAFSPFGFMASSLPKTDVTVPVVEAALINVAVSGITVDNAVPLDQILSFRERHKVLAGRLRAALLDVAATIRADVPMNAVAGQVEAAIKNRVEPALSALESELQKGRLSFAWSNMFGAGGVVAGGLTTSASIGSGAYLVGRAIKYAFDRDALVRDHPYGYLHQVRTSFLPAGTDALDGAMPLHQPEADLADLLAKMYLAAFSVEPRGGFMAWAAIGERTTDPVAAASALRSVGRPPAKTDRWWMHSVTRAAKANLPRQRYNCKV